MNGARFELALVLLALAAPDAAAQESCATCHGELGLLEQGRAHHAAGVSCVDCHGGVPGALTVEEAHAGGVRVPADARASLELCGTCHADVARMKGTGLRTDQLLLYAESGHGMLLEQDGAAPTATCVSCHGAHGVLPPADPRAPTHPRNQPDTCGACHADAERMAPYELDAGVVAEYRESVHGHALLELARLAAPACTGCHGAHGAAPPEVEEVEDVCGRCHTRAAESFQDSPHHEAALEGYIPACASCHGSHGVSEPGLAMLTGDGRGSCASCHGGSEEVVAVATALSSRLGELDRAIEATAEDLASAAERGVLVERAEDWLEEARAAREAASPLVHSLSPEALGDALDLAQGMVAEAREGLDAEHAQLQNRRIFVAVFALVVLALAAVLAIHARDVARRATGAVFGRRADAAPEEGAARG